MGSIQYSPEEKLKIKMKIKERKEKRKGMILVTSVSEQDLIHVLHVLPELKGGPLRNG